MPFCDGRSITMWRDLDRTCAELARFSKPDADAYRNLLTEWQAMAPIVNDEREHPPRPPREVAARTRAAKLGERMLAIRESTALDVIMDRFTDEHVRAFFAWIAFMTLHPLDEPETGLLAFSLVAVRQRFSWILPEGGSIRSEEHTSELQSRSDLVCRLLLEKKKIYNTTMHVVINDITWS